MPEINTNSIRGEIMNMVKTKFESLPFWGRIEKDIALLCSELPEPNTKDKKFDFIKRLKDIKVFLSKENITARDLDFLVQEIELYEKTTVMSKYKQEDNSLDYSIIEGYTRLAKGSEGIVSISQPFNYEQLSFLSNGVFKRSGFVNFYVSTEKTIYGKITAEIYDYSTDIPIATIIESKKIDKDTGEKVKIVKLFGEGFSKTEFKIIREVNMPFYIYRFITENNTEMMLLCTTKHDVGDYMITGMETKCNDYKMVTDSMRIQTKLPFFFAQSLKGRIIQFRNHTELKDRLEQLKITKKNLFDFPFTVTKNKKTWQLVQPNWYKHFIWSWLTHSSKGIFNNYPMHVMIVGPKMSGKSLLLNSLHSRSKEARSIFSGSSSTLKHLIPSFKYNPARIGYLAESNRFSFCDEFFRCLINTKTTKDGSQREESVALMNDLLEHQNREAGSGVSRISNVNMTSRILATTNPIRNMDNVESLIKGYDESFLSRWMIYHQTEDHVQMIRRSNDSNLKLYNFDLDTNDWIGILDYLHTFSAIYDMDRVKEIYEDVRVNLTENLNKHYDARHKHHLECIIDGIIKSRCIMEGDMLFEAKEEDYIVLKEVWCNLIRSWLDTSKIKNIEINNRIFYLPENSQFLYHRICNEKKIISTYKCKEIALKGMSKIEFYESYNILLDMGMIIESNGAVRPHYLSHLEDENQQGLFKEKK